LLITAQALVAGAKGLLAIDESNATCNLRFAELGIAQTEASRRAYRQLLLTTPGLNASISGVILYDETIHQATADGTPFVSVMKDAGLMVGIKVDTGAQALAGHPHEKVTEGLDGLRERLQSYAALGACFAKWRAVIALGDGLPTAACIAANAQALARYAALCQEAGLLPIVEPEVLMEGDHSLARCAEVTQATLHAVFTQLRLHDVTLEALILKPNMVLPGLSCERQESVEEVADATLKCLLRAVPAAVPGIAFLSGGQAATLATARLNAMHVRAQQMQIRLPWALTFSFARAIQQPALALWLGQDANVAAAQTALRYRAVCNRAAALGRCVEVTESDAADSRQTS
jgi:fructose-bisphosphate aldolase, class I